MTAQWLWSWPRPTWLQENHRALPSKPTPLQDSVLKRRCLPPPHPHLHRDILPRRPCPPPEALSPCPIKGPGQALGQQQELRAGETEWGLAQKWGEVFNCKQTASPIGGAHRHPRNPAWDPASAQSLSGSRTKVVGPGGGASLAMAWGHSHGILPSQPRCLRPPQPQELLADEGPRLAPVSQHRQGKRARCTQDPSLPFSAHSGSA